LTTKATGADQNGAITLSLVGTQVKAAPASLSGGAGTTYDTGTITANINGTAVTTSYGQSSTVQTVAGALATAISGAGAGVTATAGTAGAITVTAMQPGTAANGWTVTLSSATNESKFFSSPSFSGTSGTLSGGEGSTSTPGPVYSYSIGSSGYAANGNLGSYTDLINGGWSFTYDHVNRVHTAVATSGAWNNLTLSWNYDSFGNRTAQTPGGQNVLSPVPQAQTLNYPSQNHISNYSAAGYDAAGDVTYDLVNNYLYDPEGRLCAVSYFNGLGTEYMLYLYDGEGRRVAKVNNPTFSCTLGTGYTLLETYLLGPSGEHITELGQVGAFLRSNVYANGQLLASYTNNTTYFALNDWLGTKRVVTNYAGSVAQMCMNLPFGDELICSANDLSEQHFTGQIHDQETGNDYFNATYYSNSTGRFLSPDPSGLTYADPTNPQSLNLYSYVNNNPLFFLDPSGLGLQVICNSVPDSFADSAGGVMVTGYSDSCTYTDDGQDGLTQPTTSFQKQSPQPINLPARHFVVPNNSSTCVQTSLAVRLAAAVLSDLSSITGKGFSFGYSASGTYALGVGVQAGGGQALVTTTNGTAGVLTYGAAGVTGGFGASASMNLDFGVSTYGTLGGYAGSSSGGSASFYDGVGGGASITGNQSGVQGVVSVGVGAGGSTRAGGTYGASYGKAVPIC
jgi:RHS repeat-associated protein